MNRLRRATLDRHFIKSKGVRMRRAVLCVLALAAVGTGAAWAQGTSNMYAGVSVGPIFGQVTAFGVRGYFGMDDVFGENFGVRGALGLGFAANQSIVTIAADVRYDFDLGGGPLKPYAGGGLRFGFVNYTSDVCYAGICAGGQGVVIGVGALAGAEYAFAPGISAFGELDLSAVSLIGFVPSIDLGVNYRF